MTGLLWLLKSSFPSWPVLLKTPKHRVVVDDGIEYIKQRKNEFDIIIIDSTEPVGPAVAAIFIRISIGNVLQR